MADRGGNPDTSDPPAVDQLEEFPAGLVGVGTAVRLAQWGVPSGVDSEHNPHAGIPVGWSNDDTGGASKVAPIAVDSPDIGADLVHQQSPSFGVRQIFQDRESVVKDFLPDTSTLPS